MADMEKLGHPCLSLRFIPTATVDYDNDASHLPADSLTATFNEYAGFPHYRRRAKATTGIAEPALQRLNVAGGE
jgi:hypothetical protein